MDGGFTDERKAPVSSSWATRTPEDVQPVADRVVLRITCNDYETFRQHLVRRDKLEYAAYLVAGTHRYEKEGETVLEHLVRGVVCVPPFKYTKHTAGYVGIPADVTREMMDSAAMPRRITDDAAILVAHSHPWDSSPRYSSTDNDAEPPQLASITAERQGPHGPLIAGSESKSLTGRVWPTDADTIRDVGPSAATPIDEVVVLGDRTFDRFYPTDSRLDEEERQLSSGEDEMRDRQALVHGPEGNAALADADVTVVSAGGIGSKIIEDLAGLGVGRGGGSLTIIDPDVIEESNRSRIPFARPEDAGDEDATPDEDGVVPAQWSHLPGVGTPKADAAKRYIESVDPRITVNVVREVAQSEEGMKAIRTADLVVAGVDNQLPRRLVSKACQQYLRPYVDAGTAIDTDGTTTIASRVSFSGAGQPCLDCLGAINEDRLQAEQHGDDEEAYGVGDQPAVTSVNGEASHRASWFTHRYLTGLFDDRVDFNTGTWVFGGQDMAAEDDRDPECVYCGDDAIFRALGDRAPSPHSDLDRRKPSRVRDQTDRGRTEAHDTGPISVTERLWASMRSIVGSRFTGL